MSEKLTKYELKVLRHLKGESVPGLRWGAAMGEAVEHLTDCGYLSKHYGDLGIDYVITDKGRVALTEAITRVLESITARVNELEKSTTVITLCAEVDRLKNSNSYLQDIVDDYANQIGDLRAEIDRLREKQES